MPPSLSIIIPSHSRADLLSACLRSVRQHAPAGTQILVVDDGSADGHIRRTACQFSGVQCLRFKRRLGFARAANAGLQTSAGEVVEFLNDDTEVTPGWAEAALTVFSRPEVAAVAPLVLRHPCSHPSRAGHEVLDSAGDCYYQGGIAGKRGHGRPVSEAFLQSCAVFGASASSAFFRRQALREVGGFPEDFGAYFEDVDLAFRLHWAGWEVQFEPASRVYHHVHGSYGATNRRVLEQQSANEERVFWRNLPRHLLPHAVPAHVAVLAAKAWRRWQEGTLLPFLLGRFRLLGEVRALQRHRQELHDRYPRANWRSWQIQTRYEKSA